MMEIELDKGSMGQKVLAALDKHLEYGVPLEEMDLTERQKKRLAFCFQVWNLMQSDPNMDLTLLLKTRFNRTPQQVINDRQIISHIVSKLNAGDRVLDEFRVRKNAERIIRMGESAGDWKAIEAGTKIIKEVAHVGQPEAAEDLNRNTAMLQPVLVAQAGDVIEGKKTYTREELNRKREQYGASKDAVMDMIEVKENEFMSVDEVRRIVAANALRKKYGLDELKEEQDG